MSKILIDLSGENTRELMEYCKKVIRNSFQEQEYKMIREEIGKIAEERIEKLVDNKLGWKSHLELMQSRVANQIDFSQELRDYTKDCIKNSVEQSVIKNISIEYINQQIDNVINQKLEIIMQTLNELKKIGGVRNES